MKILSKVLQKDFKKNLELKGFVLKHRDILYQGHFLSNLTFNLNKQNK